MTRADRLTPGAGRDHIADFDCLRQLLMQTTHVAAKTRGTYLGAQYRRIAARRGKKRALVALAHTILLIVYHILTRREPYRELGGMYFDQSPVGVAGPGAPAGCARLLWTVVSPPSSKPQPRGGHLSTRHQRDNSATLLHWSRSPSRPL